MKKTSLYLEPELDATLARIAERDGISKAELIRRTLRGLAAAASTPRLTAIGVGRGPGDVSDDVDRHLTETGFGLAITPLVLAEVDHLVNAGLPSTAAAASHDDSKLVRSIATLDERRFRTLRPVRRGQAFELLPFDHN